MKTGTHNILLGGIGDDAHSVGIYLLELGLREAGYYVHNLGIRNSLDSFFEIASNFDVVLISNKNGHAELYLADFPRLLNLFRLQDDRPKLWYLGGSLSVSESDFAIKKKFLDYGFTNVYPKVVSLDLVLQDIEENLGKLGIPKRFGDQNRDGIAGPPKMDLTSVSDQKMSDADFRAQQLEIQHDWPEGPNRIGSELNRNLKKMPLLDQVLDDRQKSGGGPLFQPRTGVADIERQTDILQYLESEGSDVSSVQLDAACRSKKFKMAWEGYQMSIDRKNSVLNGFPIAIYPVDQLQEMLGKIKTPFQLRGGGPDHRYVYQVALQANVAALEGGALCYLMPYDKLTSPLDSLRYWQYIDRLCGKYAEENGVNINREFFGVLTANLIEPSLAIVVNIIQSILAAYQGVRSLSVGYAEQGNRSQDIAAIHLLAEMVPAYLKQFGFSNQRITTVFHQFMAAFPGDYEKSCELIYESSITATLSGATKVMVKTAVESMQIPDKYENAKAIQLCKKGAANAKKHMANWKQVEEEKKLIRREVNQLMQAILVLGDGQVGKGALKAIEMGILDIPWSPNQYNAGKVICARDVDGAIRFYDTGNMPFTADIKEYHHEKITHRKKMERKTRALDLLENDLSRIWKCDYQKWPLDGIYVV